MSAWQPIDTAPKDNARPLYFARFNEAGQLLELDHDGGWDEVNEGFEATPQSYWAWCSANGIEEPTHWAYQDEAPPAARVLPPKAIDIIEVLRANHLFNVALLPASDVHARLVELQELLTGDAS